VSEQAPERPGSEKKIAGIPRTAAIIIIAVIGGIAFIWWRNRAASSASSQTTAADTTGIDYGGELSTLQSEYGNLASEISAMQGTAGPPGPPGPKGPPGPPVKVFPPFRPPVKVFPPFRPPGRKPPAKKKLIPARTITVPKNATLLSLSQKYLGTADRTQLAHANRLGTGAGLHAGQKLLIPAHYA
jgi:hypothetical protein